MWNYKFDKIKINNLKDNLDNFVTEGKGGKKNYYNSHVSMKFIDKNIKKNIIYETK